MSHKHSVLDKDTHFIIDPVTRAITTTSEKLAVMQFDHNSERLTFEMPRYIEGHDMSLCNKVEAHFLNIDTKTKDQISGHRVLEDFRVSEDDESKVVVSWTITKGATKLGGLLHFLLNFRCMEGDVETYAWHTDFFKNYSVKGGLDAAALFESEYIDVIEQWKASVMQYFTDDLTAWKTSTLSQLRKEYIEKVDYVTPEMFGAKGDGKTDDSEAFQNAFDSGKKVYISEKIYMLEQHIDIKNNLDIVSHNATITGKGFQINGSSVRMSGVAFKDIEYNAVNLENRASLMIDKCLFENIGIHEALDVKSQGCAIYAGDNAFVAIQNSKFVECHGHGAVFCYGQCEVNVYDSLFSANYYRAICFQGNGITKGCISRNRIEECGKYNDTGSGVGCNGIYSTNGGGVVLEHNIILQSRENAIEGAFLKIADNYIDGTGVEPDVKPTPSTEGIFLQPSVKAYVAHNTILNAGGYGIKTYSDSAITEPKIIVGNIIRGCKTGAIDINSAINVSGVQIINNIVDDDVTLNNFDMSNVYIGDLSKLKGKSDISQNKELFVYHHYFDAIEPFRYSNCSPQIMADDSGESCIQVEYGEYAKLIYDLPSLKNTKHILVFSILGKGHFNAILMKNGAYYQDILEINSEEYLEKEYSIQINGKLSDKFKIYIEFKPGTVSNIKTAGIQLYR